jgi:hypothetical protein
MPGASILLRRACWLLLPALLAGIVLVSGIGQRGEHFARPVVPLHDWDISRLVAYLNGKGLGLRLVSTRQDGVVDRTAFLTTTAKEWVDFNHLYKARNQIDRWEGTLACERGPAPSWSDLASLWGDCCLVVGPFLFFGDQALLGRVRVALTGLA